MNESSLSFIINLSLGYCQCQLSIILLVNIEKIYHGLNTFVDVPRKDND